MSDNTDIQPLPPLGDSTDSYNFANGVMAYYVKGGPGVFVIHATRVEDGDVIHEPAVQIPANLYPVIKAVAKVMGLSDDEAIQLAYAAECYAHVRPVVDTRSNYMSQLMNTDVNACDCLVCKTGYDGGLVL